MPDTPAHVKAILTEEAKRAGVSVKLIGNRELKGGALSKARDAAIKRIHAETREAEPPATFAQIGDWCGVSKQRAHQIVHGRDDALSR